MNEYTPALRPVGVDEIRWLRTRRRTAVTDVERAEVRAALHELAADLERRPTTPKWHIYIVLGIGAIAVGFALGWGIYQLADSMWLWLNS